MMASRHEDILEVGVPDVSFWLKGYGNGWIELKSIDTLPARETTNITFGLKPEQIAFLIERRGWLFARVMSPRLYVLMNWVGVTDIKNGTMTKDLVNFYAYQNRMDWDLFVRIIRREADATR